MLLYFLKLWESFRKGNNAKYTTIEGSVNDFQNWFLGDKHVMTNQFTNNVLKRAIKEIEAKMNVEVSITSVKNNRTLVGYELLIVQLSNYQ